MSALKPAGRPLRRWPSALVAALLLASGGTVDIARAAPTGMPTDVNPPSASTYGQLIVKLAEGADIASVNARLGSTTRSVVLASRSIYLIEVPVVSGEGDDWKKDAERFVKLLDKDPDVVYAEANHETDTEDDRFHYWPAGVAQCVASTLDAYEHQPAVESLRLPEVHSRATGDDVVVAVLDTGMAASHPALHDRVAPGGYDYVDDDSAPDETQNSTDRDGDGLTDEAYGHGTFVSGVVALVAPGAKILPMRVLDSEGRGNTFVVAQALYDAVDLGADVVNMSFGTGEKIDSRVFYEAVKSTIKAGVIVVGAAGNDGSNDPHYPAAMPGVLGVGAMDEPMTGLAHFSSRGKWVEVAAPGVDIISTLPCGYGTWSGTSMAAPFVAGSAAVLSGPGSDRDPKDVAKAIRDRARKVHGVEVSGGALDLLASLPKG